MKPFKNLSYLFVVLDGDEPFIEVDSFGWVGDFNFFSGQVIVSLNFIILTANQVELLERIRKQMSHLKSSNHLSVFD